MPTGLGSEKLWISPTNDNTGSATALNDLSSGGNNATIAGTAAIVSDTTGSGTYAFEFDGGIGGVRVASSNLSVVGLDYSMSVWVNIAVDNRIDPFLQLADPSGNYRNMYLASFSDSKTYFGHNQSAGFNHINTTTSLGGLGWMHVAGTYNQTTQIATLYVNGTSVATGSVPRPLNSGTGEFFIGSREYASTFNFLDGKLDDVRIYEHVLTQSEITHLATARGVLGSPTPPIGLGGEKLWLCPTIDDSADDLSGNGNNGTYVGGAGTVADTGSGGSLAYEFNGTTDAISTLFADTSTTSTGVFSMACWVKHDSLVSSGLLAAQIETNNVGLGLVFDTFDSSRGHGGLLNPKVTGVYSGRVYAGDRDTANTGQWYHVAYTGDGSTARIYVDGVEEGSTAQTLVTALPWTVTLQLGRSYVNTGPINYLDGRIDDARVYTRTISQDEITHLASSRGILGGPTTGLYNPFINKIFNNDYTRRIR